MPTTVSPKSSMHPFSSMSGKILAVVLLVCVALPAHAEKVVVFARGTGPGSDRAAALVGHYAKEVFAQDDHYELVGWDGHAAPDRERVRALRSFAAADDLFSRARKAYDHLDLDTAQSALKNALARYDRAAAYVADFKKLADAYLLLGAVGILRGENEAGALGLEQALNVYPASEPDPRIFNPSMRNQFAQVAQRLSLRAPGALTVTSTPGYAEVFVDGAFVGVTPAVVDGLSEGRHFVRLQRDGYAPWGRVVDITSRQEASVNASMRAAPQFDLLDLRLDDTISQLGERSRVSARTAARDRRDLGRLAGADTLFIARVRLEGERVQIKAQTSRVAQGNGLKSGSHTFAYDSHMQTFEHEVTMLLQEHFGLNISAHPADKAAVGSAGDIAVTEQKTPTAAAADVPTNLPHAGSATRCWGDKVSCRKLKVILGTTSLILGVGGLTAGAVEYALAAQTHTTWRKLVQIDPQMPVLRARGRNQAVAGDVFMGLGAAFTVAGSLTFALWHPGPSVNDVSSKQRDPGAVDLSAPRGSLQLHVSPLLAARGGVVQATLAF